MTPYLSAMSGPRVIANNATAAKESRSGITAANQRLPSRSESAPAFRSFLPRMAAHDFARLAARNSPVLQPEGNQSSAAIFRIAQAHRHRDARHPGVLEPEGEKVQSLRPSAHESHTQPHVFGCGCMELGARQSGPKCPIAERPSRPPSTVSDPGASAATCVRVARTLPHHRAHRCTNRPPPFGALWSVLDRSRFPESDHADFPLLLHG